MEKKVNRKWGKASVTLCIVLAAVNVMLLACVGEWKSIYGWVAAMFWAIGWRIEMNNADADRSDALYWKSLYMGIRHGESK